MPFNMGGMGDGGADREVDNETFYESLGLEKGCAQNEVKKAYMKLARVGECVRRACSFLAVTRSRSTVDWRRPD